MSENRIFITHKPIFESSNAFLGRFKRRLQLKKAGFSGTLDPFAKGVLLIASGSYPRLFPHFQMESKAYQATLWLGVSSPSLDIENIHSISVIPPYPKEKITRILQELQGNITYTPPSFSAKKVQGKRAYALARAGQEVALEPIEMRVFGLKLIHYNHPFITFLAVVSKGGYVRSLGQMIADKLGVCGVLSSLERLSEGEFSFSNTRYFKDTPLQRDSRLCYQELDALAMLPYPILKLPDLREKFLAGKKLNKKELNLTTHGRFTVEFEDFFSIIEVEETDIVYLLNRIGKC